MSTKPEQNLVVDMFSPRGDFSVKPTNLNIIPHFDGPTTKNGNMSPEFPSSLSDTDTSSASEMYDLDSSVPSPKSIIKDSKSDMSVKECETVEEPLGFKEHIEVDNVEEDGEIIGDTGVEVKKADDVHVEGQGGTEHNDQEAEIAAITETSADSKADDDELLALESLIRGPATIPIPTKDADVTPVPVGIETLKNTQEVTDSSAPVTDAEDDVAVTDSEEIVVSAPQPPQDARSIPSNLRQQVPVPAAHETGQHTRQHGAPLPSRYLDIPRAPRNQSAPDSPYNNNNNHQPYGRREELVRMNAYNVKLRNELGMERKKVADMRQSVGLEFEKSMDEALSTMTSELLNKQAKLLAQKFRAEAKERDLEYREHRIVQVEVYLAEGQKQVHRFQQGELDGLTMAEVDREHDRCQAELTAQKKFADREAQALHRLQALELREAAQEMREEHYKALLRGSFKAGLHEKAVIDMDTKLEEFGDLEYHRGLKDGKVAGRAEGGEDTSRKGFLDGYAASQRAQIALSKLRSGAIAPNHPDLNFLYDAAHPHHLFSMGARVGIKEATSSAPKTQPKQVRIAKEIVVKEVVQEAVQEKVEEPKEEEIEMPVRKVPSPARPTFASELRGAQTMHNGHFVLANGGNKGIKKEEGRPIIEYDSKDEVNLIDLY